MRPIASDQSHPGLALTDVFGSKGQVRLLRVLATETDGFVTSAEVASRAGMTPSGARKALKRLARSGVVDKMGVGRGTRYSFRRKGEFAEKIARLFELERNGFDPGRAPEGRQPEEKAGNGKNGNGTSVLQPNLDPDSPEFQCALVALLEENLSLIKRARENVREKLEHRHPGNGHDDWEWRKILDTYPLPKLLHFLESDSPRAVRLRSSSPFAEVISDQERKRLGEFVDRVH